MTWRTPLTLSRHHAGQRKTARRVAEKLLPRAQRGDRPRAPSRPCAARSSTARFRARTRRARLRSRSAHPTKRGRDRMAVRYETGPSLRQYPPAARGVGDRHDRHLRKSRSIDNAATDAHRWAARSVRSDRNAIPLLQLLQYHAQRRQAASPGRTGNRIDAEIATAPAMIRPSRCAEISMCMRRHAPPRHRDHQHTPMPECADKSPPLGDQPAWHLSALDGPAIGAVDEPDVAVHRPARRPPQPSVSQKAPPRIAPGGDQGHSAIAQERQRPSCVHPQIASHRAGHRDRRGRAAPRVGRFRRCVRDRRRRSDPRPGPSTAGAR